MRRPASRTAGLSALDGLTNLGLPTPGGVSGQLSVQPALLIERSGYAGVLRLPLPPGWKDSRIGELDLVVASDDSGSMYGAWGDEHGIRRAVALSLAGVLRRGPRGSRIAALHWGSGAPTELSMGLTDPRRHPWRVRRAFEIPASLGGTNLAAGLERARDLLADSPPERLQLVIVLTDGLQEPDAEIEHELALLPARSVHILLVDRQDNCTAELEQRWRSLPFGSFTRLDLDNAQLSWQAAEILANAVGLQMPRTGSSTVHFTTQRR